MNDEKELSKSKKCGTAEQRYFSPHSQSSVKMVVRCHCAI